MKKSRIILLIVISAVVATVVSLFTIFFVFFGGMPYGTGAEIEIDSYRLCQDSDGKDVIIIKYLLKNNDDEPTALYYEGDFYVYQDGVSLTEYQNYYYYDSEKEIPNEWDYDSEDQYKMIKGGVEYYAEIAYVLEYTDKDVEVEVIDYEFFDKKKVMVFEIK